jgi:hypothetical protein
MSATPVTPSRTYSGEFNIPLSTGWRPITGFVPQAGLSLSGLCRADELKSAALN